MVNAHLPPFRQVQGLNLEILERNHHRCSTRESFYTTIVGQELAKLTIELLCAASDTVLAHDERESSHAKDAYRLRQRSSAHGHQG